jgi:galactokinase
MKTNLLLSDVAGASGLVVEKLRAAGFSDQAAAGRAELFAVAAANLKGRGLADDTPVLARFVPGRIEVLGKHTDYAGGRSLLAAVERGFCVVAAARDDRVVRVSSKDAAELAEFELDPELQPTMGDWSNYPMTVGRRIARNFPGELRGAEMAVASDLPIASGMSSSSALMVTCFLALSDINDLTSRPEFTDNVHSPEELAGYLGTVENGQTFGSLAGDKGVGTFGGSEDHTAMLCCKPGRLSVYSFCPVLLEGHVEMPAGYVFAIGSSGVAAEKTGAAREKFNRLAGLTVGVAEAWRQATGRDEPHMAAAVAAAGADEVRRVVGGATYEGFSGDELLERFEQFVAESTEIIPAAAEALKLGNMAEFGDLVARSQHLTETKLKNQVDEQIFLARAAREQGAVAASAFGAGFGGSVWSLVAQEKADEYLDSWATAYHSAYPQHESRSGFFLTRPASAAIAID